MRQTVFLFGAILLFAAGAIAQNGGGELLPQAAGVSGASATQSMLVSSPLLAEARLPGSPESSDPVGPVFSSAPAAQQPPSIYGVFPTYNWQLFLGYTFMRFYEVPSTTESLNGLDIGMVYYPKGLWVGGEGDMTAAFGSQGGQTAKFLTGMGGVRFRWSAPRAVELWAHGLAGESHYLPQTSYGNQTAFAYEFGGGIDILAHHQRLAYRAEVDSVGTRYFNTYQYSPKIAVGIVFKF